MVGCLLAIVSIFLPRFVMLCIFVFTDYFSKTYETIVFPVLGFLFMPYTTLAYMGAILSTGKVENGWVVVLIIAVLLDLSVSNNTSENL